MAKYSRPLAELTEQELLLSVGKEWEDAGACRAELSARGWTEDEIERYAA